MPSPVSLRRKGLRPLRQYLDLLAAIRKTGTRKGRPHRNRRLSLFGRQMRFDLAEGFPLVTTKKLHVKSIIHELLWFLQGSTNVRYLNEHGVTFGTSGPTRTASSARLWPQWRSWPTPTAPIDQIAQGRGGAQARPQFAAAHRQRLECRRARPDGAAALPLPVPVLCGRRYDEHHKLVPQVLSQTDSKRDWLRGF